MGDDKVRECMQYTMTEDEAEFMESWEKREEYCFIKNEELGFCQYALYAWAADDDDDQHNSEHFPQWLVDKLKQAQSLNCMMLIMD